jgi:hypothetical protein
VSTFLLFASLLCAQELDAIASARLETAAGNVPVPVVTTTATPDQSEDTRRVLSFEVAPAVSGILTTRMLRTSLSYNPRIYYRTPGNGDPLILHRGTLTYRHAILRDLTLDTNVIGSYGEVDYGRDSLLPPEIVTLGGDEVLGITSLSGGVALIKSFNATDRLEFEVRPSYAKPSSGETELQAQIRVGGDVSYTVSLDRQNELMFVAGGETVEIEMVESLRTTFARARYEYTFTRDFTVHAQAGVAAAFNDFRVLPLGEVGIVADLLEGGGSRLTSTLLVGVESFVSPLLGTFDSRFTSTLTLTAELGPNLDIGLISSFYTLLTPPDDAMGMSAAAAALAETVVSARLPITYRFNQELSLETGLRTSLRGPRVTNPMFELGQLEFVGYVSVLGTIDTTPPAFAR